MDVTDARWHACRVVACPPRAGGCGGQVDRHVQPPPSQARSHQLAHISPWPSARRCMLSCRADPAPTPGDCAYVPGSSIRAVLRAPALNVRSPVPQRRRRYRSQRAAHADAAHGLLHDRLLDSTGEAEGAPHHAGMPWCALRRAGACHSLQHYCVSLIIISPGIMLKHTSADNTAVRKASNTPMSL